MMGRSPRYPKKLFLQFELCHWLICWEAAEALSKAAKTDGFQRRLLSHHSLIAHNLAEKANASVAVVLSLFENDQKALARSD